MAIEGNSDEVISTYNESYYEERACEEEIYLEQTEEELRSELIGDTPPDDRAKTKCLFTEPGHYSKTVQLSTEAHRHANSVTAAPYEAVEERSVLPFALGPSRHHEILIKLFGFEFDIGLTI